MIISSKRSYGSERRSGGGKRKFEIDHGIGPFDLSTIAVDCGCGEFDGNVSFCVCFCIVRLVHAVKLGTAFEL